MVVLAAQRSSPERLSEASFYSDLDYGIQAGGLRRGAARARQSHTMAEAEARDRELRSRLLAEQEPFSVVARYAHLDKDGAAETSLHWPTSR